jgi:hypothetical protein
MAYNARLKGTTWHACEALSPGARRAQAGCAAARALLKGSLTQLACENFFGLGPPPRRVKGCGQA